MSAWVSVQLGTQWQKLSDVWGELFMLRWVRSCWLTCKEKLTWWRICEQFYVKRYLCFYYSWFINSYGYQRAFTVS